MLVAAEDALGSPQAFPRTGVHGGSSQWACQLCGAKAPAKQEDRPGSRSAISAWALAADPQVFACKSVDVKEAFVAPSTSPTVSKPSSALPRAPSRGGSGCSVLGRTPLSVLGKIGLVSELPHPSAPRSQGRQEDTSFLLPAPAQPSQPCGCALPASPQGSERRESAGGTPRPVLEGAPHCTFRSAGPSVCSPHPAPPGALSALCTDPRFAPFLLP